MNRHFTLRTVPLGCALVLAAPTYAKPMSYAVPITISATTPANQTASGTIGQPVANKASPTPSPSAAPRTPAPMAGSSASTAPKVQRPAALPVSASNVPSAPVAQAGADAPLDLPESAIELTTGSQRVIALSDLPARVALAEPDIAEVTVLKPVARGGKGAALLIVAKQAGSTSLLVWPRGQDRPIAYSLNVNTLPIQTMAPVPDITLQNRGNAVRLDGTVKNIAAYQQAKDNLQRSSIGGKPVELTDTATLSTSGTVQVDVKVVEFSRSDLQRLGISFSNTNGSVAFNFGSLMNNTLPGNAINQALNITYMSQRGLMAQLGALQSQGMVRVLAEPSLIAQSGQTASFLAGGEIPIPVPTGSVGAGSFTIQFKEFGVRLGFTPTILSSKTIALKVTPEVSDLDRNNGVALNGFNIPALNTRRADTTVELGEGESFVIGGLISSNMLSNVQKFPLLADIPILGGFFRNVVYEKQDKELVIIATPRFVKPRAKGAPPLPLPGGPAMATRPGWGQMFLPSGDGTLPGFSR